MEKSALITEKMNIQLEDVRKESRRFYESKKKKRSQFRITIPITPKTPTYKPC